MPTFIIIVSLALICLPLWPCGCLFVWMLWHRRVRVPQHRTRAAPREEVEPRAKRHPRAKPEWMRQRVIYLATHLDSCRAIAHAFNRWHRDASVGKSWVARFVKDNADEIAQRRRKMRQRLPAFVAVGQTWALDLTFVTSPDGFMFTVLGIIDQGSRRLLCLKALPTKCTFMLLGHLFLAFARYGLPAAMRSDNESIFTSKLWCCTLKALGIAHRRGPPGQPWCNGRMERLFGTLKPLLRKIRPATEQALTNALNGFRRFYNEVRPHQNLGGLTPIEVWEGKRLTDVQQAQTKGRGQLVQALGGLMVGYHVRC